MLGSDLLRFDMELKFLKNSLPSATPYSEIPIFQSKMQLILNLKVDQSNKTFNNT